MTVASPAQQRLAIATGRLLEPNDLDTAHLDTTLAGLHGGGTDFADLYFETTTRESWRLEDQCVTSGDYSVSQGVGVRTVAGDRSALAYSSDLSARALKATVQSAREMQLRGTDAARTHGVPGMRENPPGLDLYTRQDILGARDAEGKIALLRDLDRRARAVDPRIRRVTARLEVTETVILVAASDGTLAADVRPMIRMNLRIVAEQNGGFSTGSAGVGGRYGFDGLTEAAIDRLIARSTRTALVNLDARPAPAGVMPVVLGPGFPGILLHEAVGHGLEGDAHRTRSSVFAEYMGEMIAAKGVTVVDDATLPRLAGSLHVDDEGTPGERTVLIEKGKLTGLMQDRMNARFTNSRSTGNSRRESYAHMPMPRMTNTFLEAGEQDPAEIVASVQNGIYAAEFGGGTVDITSGRFNFSATEAYLIENGKITAPIRGATLIGVGHEALKHISMIGNDLALDDGEAVCGKQGQSVFVGVGQPTVRIDEMVVGGSA
ncbi:MAG: metalloprotease TldD [Sphingobium sp.]|uniref:metalloprotease TldD n=1 Tax=Sphingobium sp. TaxID=1912891 RepID=UPI000DB05B8C|nr:metalloprotease TldD [Sphingobium sp.]PZU06942.1 MAG: metalloprotease TldD [Sphingobium sp.]